MSQYCTDNALSSKNLSLAIQKNSTNLFVKHVLPLFLRNQIQQQTETVINTQNNLNTNHLSISLYLLSNSITFNVP